MDARAMRTWFDQFDWVWTPAEYAVSGFPIPEGTTVAHGFVVRPDRERLVWVRRRSEAVSWRKLRKARRWARVIAWIPWVRMIAIGNDLGYRNCRPESDIDLVIVTVPRRIWLTRFFVSGSLKLLRQRPGERSADALCPSFFLTTDALNLEPLQIACGMSDRNHSAFRIPHSTFPPDPYLLFWVTQLTVLFDRGGTYDAFWRANARWVRAQLPHAQPRGAHPRLMRSARARTRSTVWGDALERRARRFQEQRLPTAIRALANRGTRVVVTDRMIKLHANDRRQEYRARWIAAMHA